jgi:hypothetical protein
MSTISKRGYNFRCHFCRMMLHDDNACITSVQPGWELAQETEADRTACLGLRIP